MRYLVISDLHSNWQALEAVLAHAAGQYEKIVCCGDVVGYGPDPALVVDWVRNNVDITIRGNHDRACCGMEDLEWFNPVAQAASIWTMSHLTEPDLQWLRDLPRGPITIDGFSIAHGSPLDEDEYITSMDDASNLLGYFETALTFIGHTHLQGGFCWLDGTQEKLSGPQHLQINSEGVYLINPGSVGQPRDGDARAAYALLDTDRQKLRLLRVAYDFGTVSRKIEQVGLPSVLGARLSMGR